MHLSKLRSDLHEHWKWDSEFTDSYLSSEQQWHDGITEDERTLDYLQEARDSNLCIGCDDYFFPDYFSPREERKREDYCTDCIEFFDGQIREELHLWLS